RQRGQLQFERLDGRQLGRLELDDVHRLTAMASLLEIGALALLAKAFAGSKSSAPTTPPAPPPQRPGGGGLNVGQLGGALGTLGGALVTALGGGSALTTGGVSAGVGGGVVTTA